MGVLRSAAHRRAKSRFFGAFSSSPYTVPLCWAWVGARHRGIVKLSEGSWMCVTQCSPALLTYLQTKKTHICNTRLQPGAKRTGNTGQLIWMLVAVTFKSIVFGTLVLPPPRSTQRYGYSLAGETLSRLRTRGARATTVAHAREPPAALCRNGTAYQRVCAASSSTTRLYSTI